MCLDYIWSIAYQILEEYDNMVKASRVFAHLVLRSLVQHGKWGRGGGGASFINERDEVSSLILGTGELRQAVWVAGLSQVCWCTVTHHCGTVGRMKDGYRRNKGCMGKGRRKKI